MKYVLALLCVTLQVFGTQYYIDHDGGSDANPGTKAQPWKNHPFMSGWAGSYRHQAGDQFLFKGGVTWPASCFTMVITQGGIAGNPDVYTVDPTWYSGSSWTRPKFDGQSQRQSMVFIGSLNPYGATAFYVTLDNLEMCNLYWTGNPNTGVVSFVNQAYGTHDIIVQNCYIHDWTHDSYSNGTRDAMIVIPGCPGSPYNAGSVVSNCIIDGGPSNAASGASGAAFYQWGGQVRNCTIRNCVSAILVGQGNQNSIIANNNIGPTFHSFDPGSHDNGIEVNLGGSPHYIYNNYIHDTKAVCIFLGGNGGEIDYVFNNVFWNTPVSPIQLDTTVSGTQEYVWNNTLVGASSPAVRVVYRSSGGALGVLDFRNNHVIGDSDVYFDPGSSAATVTKQRNVIQSVTTAASQGYVVQNNFSPASSSVATVGAGSTISVTDPLLGVAIDIRGNTRSPVWDAGAYQYASSATGSTGGGSSSSTPQPPAAPTAASPADGATQVALTPALSASSFSDPQGSSQQGSEWIVTDSSGSSIIWDSGVQAATSSMSVPASLLNYSTSYQWQVRYENALNLWSSYSSPVTFTTLSAPPSGTPTTVSSGTIQAGDGAVTSPFVLSGGTISQSVQTTDPTSGGQAVYQFTVPSSGDYCISAYVNAPGDASNSAFIQIDSQPVAPTDIWDVVTFTSGFEWRLVCWRGDQGTFDAPQYTPKVWNLTAGTHTLYVSGREANFSIQTLKLVSVPKPPSNLRIVGTP